MHPMFSKLGIDSFNNTWYGSAEDFGYLFSEKVKIEFGKKAPTLSKELFSKGMKSIVGIGSKLLPWPANAGIDYIGNMLTDITGDAASLAAEIVIYESNISAVVTEIFKMGKNPCVLLSGFVITISYGTQFVFNKKNNESIYNKLQNMFVQQKNNNITFESLSKYINKCDKNTLLNLKTLIDGKISPIAKETNNIQDSKQVGGYVLSNFLAKLS